MFLYKEDFNKFLNALTETIGYVKTDLMPDFDFDAYNHDQENEEGMSLPASAPIEAIEAIEAVEATEDAGGNVNVDDWKM
jgi:hypothetical protein